MEKQDLEYQSKFSINKWIFWCYNYSNPDEWIAAISDGDCEFHHYRNKFDSLYDVYGSRAVMNQFYVELDYKHKKRLIEYVMSNYSDEQSLC